MKKIVAQNSIAGVILLSLLFSSCFDNNPKKLKSGPSNTLTSNKWIQPLSKDKNGIPVWGHKNGIRVGLAPMRGPRGLIRVYAPYLGLDSLKVMNFIALEPIVKGSENRSFSELETSELDQVQGKRFWSANDTLNSQPKKENDCAAGIVEMVNGMETLTLYVFSEPFESGAKVYVRIRFYENKPYEIELTAYAMEDSAPLDNFVLTATMGNFARLRNLYIKGRIKSSLNLWSDHQGTNFTEHDYTQTSEMLTDKSGSVYFVAAPNEYNHKDATYAKDTKDHWKYKGTKATQYWKKVNPTDSLKGLVNGRFTYWASASTIPGGVAIENFEFKEPFKNGAVYGYGISPLLSNDFIDVVILKNDSKD